MRIEKDESAKNYPYVIKGFGAVACSLDDLEDLAFEIERVLKEEQAKGKMQVAVKVIMG